MGKSENRRRDATLELWHIVKATKLLNNKTRKHRKKILPIKKNKSRVVTLAAMGHDNFSFVFAF